MDGDSNESEYNNYGMSSRGERLECRVIERVKCSTFKRFGYIKNASE